MLDRVADSPNPSPSHPRRVPRRRIRVPHSPATIASPRSPQDADRLPEVQLGILPAAGGCQRCPARGVRAALDMISPANSERAAKAFRLEWSDELVLTPILADITTAPHGGWPAAGDRSVSVAVPSWVFCSMAIRWPDCSSIAPLGNRCWREPAGIIRPHSLR